MLASAIEYVRTVCEVVFNATNDATDADTGNMNALDALDITRAGESKSEFQSPMAGHFARFQVLFLGTLQNPGLLFLKFYSHVVRDPHGFFRAQHSIL